MSKTKSQNIKIETPKGAVSGIFDCPAKPFAALALAHGAGAGMRHEFMQALAESLTAHGFAVLRYQFPYMEAGGSRPDRPAVATQVVAAAVSELKKRLPKLPLFAGGKSFGSRMTTTAASEGMLEGISGIICFGFPLHQPGKPGVDRAKHLAQVEVPVLFLQGTRDTLADIQLMREVCTDLPKSELHIVEGADHGFAVLKRSGRTPEDVLQELAEASMTFARSGSVQTHSSQD